MSEIRMPFDIKPEDAVKENIHPLIIQKPTEEEMKKVLEKSDEVRRHVDSLLETKPEWVQLEQARRAEEVYRADAIFCIENVDKLGEEEAVKRIKAAFVTLAGSLVHQGKLDEAMEVAWEGYRIGANTLQFLQQAKSYEVAINRDDNEWCNCQPTLIEDDKPQPKVFGGKQERVVAVLPQQQIVGSIPSYKHNGEVVNIVRCGNCGFTNAVPKDAVPAFVLDANLNAEEDFEVMRLQDGDTISRTVFGFQRISSSDRK